MNRTKYYKSTNEGRREELMDRMNLKDRPVAIDGERFTEPKGLLSSKSGGPEDDIEDNGLGIAFPPDPDYLQHKEDDIPGSGLDGLRSKGIRITSDEIRGGDGRIISRRRWD